MRQVASFLVLVVGLALVIPARAQTTISQEAMADALFQEATNLIKDGNYADACPKLDQSHRADPAGGTVLLLAICYEKVGKTASAWLRFNDALAAARADRRVDREVRAKEALAALEPRLSRVEVELTPGLRALPGFELEVDGAMVPLFGDTWSMPLDPGQHRVSARATGKLEWSASVPITRDGERVKIQVPELAEAPKPAPVPVAKAQPRPAANPEPSAAPTEPTRAPRSPRRAIGVGLAAVGLVATGFGTYFGVQALAQDKDADAACPRSPCGDEDGVKASDEALSSVKRANVLIAVGASVTASGVVLVVWPRAKTDRSTRLVLTPTADGVTLGTTLPF